MQQLPDFQKLFLGYQNTPCLWNGKLIGLQQFRITETAQDFLVSEKPQRLRLGRWVEEFAKHQISSNSKYKPLTYGLQIRKQKQTLGELDLLFLYKSQPVHLEIIYKFYLYDNTKSYNNTLEYWIGPNRTDSLVLKLDKLQSRQIPLLHHPVTTAQLIDLALPSEGYQQKVQFKAQLFLPLADPQISLGPLNNSCVYGFYISCKELYQLKAFDFYLPHKLEWLAEPHISVNWQSYEEASKNIEDQCQSHRSPLIWLKGPENHLQKAFVTWW
jgi:hypothetical protein